MKSLPPGMTVDELLMAQLLSPEQEVMSADEYLDHFGEPRRPWPPVKDRGHYCSWCEVFFVRNDNYLRHMRMFHVTPVKGVL